MPLTKTRNEDIIQTQCYTSPYGDLTLGSFKGKLCLCRWTNTPHSKKNDKAQQQILCMRNEEGTSYIIKEAILQLSEYFAGERKTFDVPLLFFGTDFQKRVWHALLEIPYAKSHSYSSISKILGYPTAVRAVANACGANKISVFVPCHRVIGSNHALTGYSGGIEVKRKLLDLELKYGSIVYPSHHVLYVT